MAEVFLKIKYMLEACYPVLYLHSYEYERTCEKIHGMVQDIRKSSRRTVNVYEWDCVSGLSLYPSKDNQSQENTENVIEFLHIVLSKNDSKEKDIFIVNDLNDLIERNEVKCLLQRIATEGPYNNTHLIIISPIINLPAELEKYVTLVTVPLPSRLEIGSTLDDILKPTKIIVNSTLRDKLIDAAMGMTVMEASLAFSLAVVKDQMSENAQITVSSEKEQIIKKSGILEYFPQNESLKDVGGMDVLKKWLMQRQLAYDKKARDWGLQEPKGILLLGVPGCGKSLTAKCIASSWNMPLLRLDIGKVYQGLMGSSEENIRKAIATAEAVAPCVMWIDEIEKGLNGTQSSGQTDGGVTSRIFSTILTWMQEKTKPVFVVATANNIDQLPPELLRKGRFDEIFFVDLPDKSERENIFKIHLKKKGQNPDNFTMEAFATKSEGFNGAEIEECIKEAMFAAYLDNPTEPRLLSKHILESIDNTVKLSDTMKEQINRLRAFGNYRAKNASIIEEKIKTSDLLLTIPEYEMEEIVKK